MEIDRWWNTEGKTQWLYCWKNDIQTDLGCFPFVRTDWPANSHPNKNFTFNQNYPDHSKPKYYVQRRWFFSKTSWKKPISLPKCLVRPWSSRPVPTLGKRPYIHSTPAGHFTVVGLVSYSLWVNVGLRLIQLNVVHSISKHYICIYN